MNLPLTKKEILLISIIILGVVGGGGIMALAQGDGNGFPDFGPEPETEQAASTESNQSEVSSSESKTSTGMTSEPKPETPKGPVNINTAGEKELARLHGIGPALSKRIVEDRAANGPYNSIDELQRVKGIGPATVEKNRDMITLGN